MEQFIMNTEIENKVFNFGEEVFFKNSRFFNCKFEHTEFTSSVFKNCEFLDCSFVNCSFDNCVFDKLEFVNCLFDNVSDKVMGNIIHNTLFMTCTFYSTNLDETALSKSCFQFCEFDHTPFSRLFDHIFVVNDVHFIECKGVVNNSNKEYKWPVLQEENGPEDWIANRFK